MKYTFILFLLVITSRTKAQTYPTPVTDTLNYLRYIVSNKQQFIGLPFSVLHDSLKINLKYFAPNGAFHFDQSKETDTQIAFNNSNNLDDFYLTYPRLEVTWEQPLNLPVAYQIAHGYQNSSIAWGSRAYQHYANGIIKNIRVVEAIIR